MDVNELRDIAENEGNYSYVESEGPDCVRFDMGDRSAWAYSSGAIEGDVRIAKALRKIANKLSWQAA